MISRVKNTALSIIAALVPFVCCGGLSHAAETAPVGANTNLAANAGFEATVLADGWEIVGQDGGIGQGVRDTTQVRSGAASLKLTKKNSVGWVELRSTKPIRVKANTKYTFRGWFHAEDAPLSSMLLFRIGGAKDENFHYDSTDRSAGYSSQSLLRNSPVGVWEKRVITFRRDEEQDVYLHIILWGNPATVWIDDLEFTDEKYKISAKPGASYTLPYSEEQVKAALDRRTDTTAEVQIINGRSALLLNGKPVPPVIYKGIQSSQRSGDYEAFGKDGIPFVITTARIGPQYYEDAIWTGKDTYNFRQVDERLLSVLRKNPNANIILDVWIYPYRNWGVENSSEIVRNAKGEGGFGSWGNLEGFTKEAADSMPVAIGNSAAKSKDKVWWYPSYHSAKWREDAGKALAALVNHVKAGPYGKAVAGFFLSGGHDGQFINFHFVDRSAPAQQAFRDWCRARYGTLEKISQVWKTPIKSWAEITIPEMNEEGHQEAQPPFLAPGAEADYREFRDVTPWQLRDSLAGVVKQTMGKPVVTIAYASPIHRAFLESKNLDACGSMTYYPYRVAGYATGWKPGNSFVLHDKLFFQEIDLRSWVADGYDEVYSGWIGAGRTPEQWDAVNRKLAGASIANDWGYWYYDMNQYYNDPQIHAKLAPSFRAAAKYYERARQSNSKWHPDVVLVTTDDPQKYISARFNSVGTAHSAGVDHQGMMLQTSGVPYDKHYLSDILQNPALQNYKVYIFEQNVFLTADQRAQIKRKLQGGGRTLVWLYDTGYISEDGKSAAQMSELTGMHIATEEKYERLVPLVENLDDPLVQGVLPLQSTNELMLAMFGLKGSIKSFSARPQLFWVDDASAKPLARYRDDGRVAMAVKRFADWTSIYIASPNSIGNDLMNNIAAQAKAYRVGAPGQSIDMNRDFLSLHGMRSENYTLQLPSGKKRVVDAITGKVLSNGKATYTFPVEAQKTYWFFFE